MTAAVCWFKVRIGVLCIKGDQINNLLSLPPDAKYYESGLHFNPQISYLWANKWLTNDGNLGSCNKIYLSLDPEVNNYDYLDHARVPTRWLCPGNYFTYFNLIVSHSVRSPEWVETANN